MSNNKPFDPLMNDRWPSVCVVAGMAQSGKTTYMQKVLQLARIAGRKSLAIDQVCTRPPQAKHLACQADYWTDRIPAQLPPDVSMVVCDEYARLRRELGADQHPLLQDIIARGQHTQLALGGCKAILGTQRPVDLGRPLVSQAKRWVLFRLRDSLDLEYVRALPGMTGQGVDFLPKLPPGYCVVLDEQDGLYLPWVQEWQR
jgi:hypothetical protein